MNLFQKIFHNKGNPDTASDLRFGRYSDSYKGSDQYDSWDISLEKFEAEDFLESIKVFFRYLRDERQDNVKWWEENGGIRFELFQGSKTVTGFANAQKLNAEAKVARVSSLHIGFMRRLIEQNYDLKYSRFALDPDDFIVIVFDTHTLDGSPYKLYYALKEMATNADKQDDLLIEEFEMLQPIDSNHVEHLPTWEKEVRYAFITAEIEAVLREIDHGKLKQDQYPGAIAYLLLDLCYRLDYLITPEGYMMELLERIHRQYFENDGKTTAQKNAVMRREFEKLLLRPKEAFFKEMYRVKSTFGITTPVNHDRLVSFIDGELHNMDWYKDNKYEQIALSIPGYIVGYCLFNYALPKPDREYLHLYFQIVENDYFKKLRIADDYYDSTFDTFNRKKIKAAIQQIAAANTDPYFKLKPNTGLLHFDSMADFAKSYLLMLRDLDLSKAD